MSFESLINSHEICLGGIYSPLNSSEALAQQGYFESNRTDEVNIFTDFVRFNQAYFWSESRSYICYMLLYVVFATSGTFNRKRPRAIPGNFFNLLNARRTISAKITWAKKFFMMKSSRMQMENCSIAKIVMRIVYVDQIMV